MTEPLQTTPSATADSHRSIRLARIGEGRFRADNGRGGETFMGSGGQDPDFTPVELLLAALAGCGAIDVDAITRKRASSTGFEVVAEGEKVRDDQGNRLVDLRLTFDVTFPDDASGDAARASMEAALRQARDRLCTVSRTVAVGTDVEFVSRA
jgi:putative redox protein